MSHAVRHSFAASAFTAALAAFGALGVTGVAHASDMLPKGWLFGVDAGASKVEFVTSAAVTQLAKIVGGTATATQDNGINVLRYYGGYKFNPYVSVEVGGTVSDQSVVNYSGSIPPAGSVTTTTTYSGAGRVARSGSDMAVVLRLPNSVIPGQPFVRVATNYLKTEVALPATANGLTPVQAATSQSGRGTSLGVGLDLTIQKGLSVRVAADRLNKISGVTESKASLLTLGISNTY